jgi:hypothetical protein
MKKRFVAVMAWINNANEKKTHAFVLMDQSISCTLTTKSGTRGQSDGSLSQFQHGGVKLTEGFQLPSLDGNHEGKTFTSLGIPATWPPGSRIYEFPKCSRGEGQKASKATSKMHTKKAIN